MLAQQQSEAANHAKSAFLANKSDELRTPLNAIIGFSEIIRDKLLGRMLLPISKMPATSTARGWIPGHVNDVLDLAKIEPARSNFTKP